MIEINVSGPAYALPYGRATAWHGGPPARLGVVAARATKTGSTTSILATGGSRLRTACFAVAGWAGAPRTMMLEKVSEPVPACRDRELPS